MNIDEILSLKFPKEASEDKITTLFDEQGNLYLSKFDVEGVAWPTTATFQSWEAECIAIKEARANNAPIYTALQEIDLKSIRALREQDSERIADLENQATALRSQLIRL